MTGSHYSGLGSIIVVLAIQNAALAQEVVPHNQNDIPVQNVQNPTSEELEEVRRGLALPARPREAYIRSLIELSDYSAVALWLIAAERPGMAWQAVRPDVRMWLRLIADLPAEAVERWLIEDESIEVRWDATGSEFRYLYHELTDSVPVSGTMVRLDQLTLLTPWPVHIIRGQVAEPGKELKEGTFGVPERLADRLLRDEAATWMEAAGLYLAWGQLEKSHITLHYGPQVAFEVAASKATNLDQAVVDIADWGGVDVDDLARIDVYLYPDAGMREYGLPPGQDYALVGSGQVHQRENATRGHELAHVVLGRAWGACGSDVVNEGLATYLNGDFDVVTMAARARVFRRKSDLERIDGVIRNDSDYLRGGAFVAYVDYLLGSDGVREVCAATNPLAALSRIVESEREAVLGDLRRWVDGGAGIDQKNRFKADN